MKEDGVEHLIVFESKQFSSAKKNYDTLKQELLVIKNALRK